MSTFSPSGPRSPTPWSCAVINRAWRDGVGGIARLWLGLALLCAPGASGCALRPRRGVDPAALQLATCRAGLLASPRSAESLDAYLQCLLGVDVRQPRSPRVYAEIAHVLYLRALAWPRTGRDDLASARGWALRCLAMQPAVEGRLRTTGGRLGPAVMAAVSAEEVDCLTWASMSWARWLWEVGAAGMGIDLETVALLADRAAELAPEFDGRRPLWAVALARGVVPAALGADPDEIAAAFRVARTSIGDRPLLRVDEAALVWGRQGAMDRWRRTLEQVAGVDVEGRDLDAYEDQAAVALAQRMLGEGPPAPAAWSP